MNKHEVQMKLNYKEYDALLIAVNDNPFKEKFKGYENQDELTQSLHSALDKITKNFTKFGLQDATDFETRKQQEVQNV